MTRRVDFHLARNPFSRWKYNHASRVLAISDKVKEVLEQDGVPHGKISVVKSGIDFSRFQWIEAIPKEMLGVPSDSLLIGQVASMADHKDQATFIKAVALVRPSFRHMRAMIVGDGELKSKLMGLAKALKVDDVIHFMGFRDDALRLLKSFDIFCLSSKEEGLGTSVLDAMALMVPVVATRAGGIPEMVKDGVTGYLAKPQDPQNLAEALNRAIIAGSNNKLICSRAFEMAKRYDISNTVSQTEMVYKLVLNAVPAS